ncbi:MAG: TonB-dependent receptor [Sphingomonas bacterium]
MKKDYILLLGGSALGSLLLGLPGLAAAEETQDTSAASPSDAGSAAKIPEVIVTAQKRAEKLQDVPISMEVLSGDKLQALHSSDFHDIQNYVPNVFVQMSAADNVIYIRGFGSSPNNFGFDQSVSLYEDGVYLGRSKQFETPFFDLERVEVLRGPQGALFGKNTAAGAVSIVTAGPTKHLEGAITGAYNFDQKGYDVTGYVAGPITDTLGARVALKFLDQDGYIFNRATGERDPSRREQIGRVTLKWSPSTSFDYTVKGEYSNRSRYGWNTVSAPLDVRSTPDFTRYDSGSPSGSAYDKTKSWNLSGTGNIYLGDFTITSVTGYSWFRTSSVVGIDQTIPGGGVSPTLVGVSWPEQFSQFSQEVRLASPTSGNLQYIVGAYYDESHYWMGGGLSYNLLGGALVGDEHNDFHQSADTVSLFGQATYRLTSKLRLVGSLRYTHNHKSATFAELLSSGAPLQPITTAQGRLNEGHVDPSATLQYDFTPDIMGYFTYGQGSKSGGFLSNTAGVTDATFSFRPEHSRNFEAGVKATLFDGRVIANVSAYDLRFTDLQVSALNPVTLSFVTGNAASATSRGVEFSLSWRPVPAFDLTASGAYQDAKYDDYVGASCLATETLVQCDPNNTASIAANNIKGTPLEFASKFMANVQAHYHQIITNDLKLDTTVGVAGRSGYFATDNYDPHFGFQPGYAKLDVRIQIGAPNDRWHLALVGKNLTNKATFSYAIPWGVPVTSDPRAIRYVEEARNIALEAGIKF